MKQDLHFLTLATADLDTARRFYSALGWQPLADVPNEIVFYQVAPGLVLGFFEASKFNRDLADGSDRSAVSGVTLSHNVDSPEEVEAVVQTMVAAGAAVLKKPQAAEFGGIFHAHVQDPNGVIWEIAHNPGWRIAQDGTVELG